MWFLLGLLLLGTTVVLDRALGLLGYSKESPPQHTHPKNFKEVRKQVEFTYTFETNSQGLRTPEIPLLRPPLAPPRVLVAGDSFTEGWGVESPQTFVKQLETKWKEDQAPLTFVNCGIAGIDPVRFGRTLLAAGMRYDADAVLVVLFANDVGDANPKAKLQLEYTQSGPLRWSFPRSGLKLWIHRLWPHTFSLLKSILEARRLKEQTRTDDLLQDTQTEAKRRNLSAAKIEAWTQAVPKDLVQAVNENRFPAYPLVQGLLVPEYYERALDLKGAEAKWGSAAQALTTIAEVCQRRNLKLAWAYAPSPLQYDPDFHEFPASLGVRVHARWLQSESRLESELSALAQKLKVPFQSLTPAFREVDAQAKSSLHYRLDGHWTPKGHALAAQALKPWLASLGWNALSAPGVH